MSAFWLIYETSPGGANRHEFQAVNLGDAKVKAKEFLRQMVLPTDRPGVSIRWAYLEHLGEKPRWPKTWLVQEAEHDVPPDMKTKEEILDKIYELRKKPHSDPWVEGRLFALRWVIEKPQDLQE